MTAATLALPLAATWNVGAQTPPPPSPPPPQQGAGGPLPGLTRDQAAVFDRGRRAFLEREERADGLGPVFNGVSCAECHAAGGVGGSSPDLRVSRVTRIGGVVNGRYADLTELGGPVLQARSLREFDPRCPIPGEVVPPGAQFVSRRITTPLFGAGLIEAIPDQAILAQVGRPDPDGVRGVANVVWNPETRRSEVGRFGWKGQHSSLHLFAGDAYLNEMGITSASFRTENLPQGRPIPAGWDSTADPEDLDDDTGRFTAFMRLLGPPAQRTPDAPQVRRGSQVFNSIRCGSCHVPELRTGLHPVTALSNKPVRLYSDLLLHRMGPQLADGIQQGQALGDQWRTAPLWGLGLRRFFLHDGRAATVADAIALHGGEAEPSRARFLKLNAEDRNALLAFLSSL
jgi:CxxC motif-containing protein (DUF1111 family)